MTSTKDDPNDIVKKHSQQALDESLTQIPNDVSEKLQSARRSAIMAAKLKATTAATVASDKGVDLTDISRTGMGKRPSIVWSGAVAASVCALAIGFLVRQAPNGFDPQAIPLLDTQDAVLAFTELDETEWGVVQELEFALWLSEFSDASSTDDFSS